MVVILDLGLGERRPMPGRTASEAPAAKPRCAYYETATDNVDLILGIIRSLIS
jgi:hypothetical protein